MENNERGKPEILKNVNIFVFGTRGFPNIQGGVEKHCEELYSAMPENFHITLFRRKSFLNRDASTQHKQIRFIDLFSTKIKGFETFFHSFVAAFYCIFHRPDIIHVHNIGPGIFIPLLKLFCHKIVLTYHSPNYEHEKWNWFAKLILKMGEKFALNGADAIIFVNKEQLKKFSKKIQEKSFYIPNGVKFQERSEQTDYLEKYGLVPQKYILAVGRITLEKGFDYLIDTFLSLQDTTYKLVIAGGIDHKTSYSKLICEKVRNRDNIVMTGFARESELRQLYSHAKLFVLSSYNEGFPLVLLEAMNYKLNVLVSNISATRGVQLPADSYFQVGDREDLLQKLHQQLAEPDSLVDYDLSAYQWKNIAAQTADIYQRLVNNNHLSQ
ncbi:MAG: glycosyltransferase family 4 protein [Candidatus Azobacteroides sp.]|nr:glycosyltransferase family 4 protein [Candidatus Azobacteroides sp.]